MDRIKGLIVDSDVDTKCCVDHILRHSESRIEFPSPNSIAHDKHPKKSVFSRIVAYWYCNLANLHFIGEASGTSLPTKRKNMDPVK